MTAMLKMPSHYWTMLIVSFKFSNYSELIIIIKGAHPKHEAKKIHKDSFSGELAMTQINFGGFAFLPRKILSK